MERPEVQQQNQAGHSGPTANQRVLGWNEPRHAPDQGSPKSCLGDREHPFAGVSHRNAGFLVQERMGVHSRPEDQVAKRPPATTARLPPSEPLAAGVVDAGLALVPHVRSKVQELVVSMGKNSHRPSRPPNDGRSRRMVNETRLTYALPSRVSHSKGTNGCSAAGSTS